MQNLNVTIIQTALHWHNRKDNLSHFTTLIEGIIEPTDLIVLPEMFTSGFTMQVKEAADTLEGETLQWMQYMANKKQAVITGSVVIEIDKKYYNRLLWVQPDGKYLHYDKRHLFRMANENDYFTAGEKRLITKLKDWNVCPLVCYDLRFPAFSRNINFSTNFEHQHQYEVLIYVANWPERRSHAWKSLLIARAFENQCYVIGVNRVGTDGNGIVYSGDSMVVSPLGEIMSTTKAHEERVETIPLSIEELKQYRAAFPVINDADEFHLK